MNGKSDHFGRMRRPTALQVSYVEELMNMRGEQRKRGRILAVAEKCGVNHAAVSRFFKACIEAGYLHDDYSLTAEGMEWLDHYISMRGRLAEHFRSMGLKQDDIERNVQAIIENTDDHVIMSMIGRMDSAAGSDPAFTERESRSEQCPIAELLEPGEYRTEFRLIKYSRKTNNERSLSMGDRGFQKPALVVCSGDEAHLILTIKELKERSAMSGEEMTGHLTGLRYEMAGHLIKAEIKEGKVDISLDNCMYEQDSKGDIMVVIPVSITVSVGRMHMPESTALLVLWL